MQYPVEVPGVTVESVLTEALVAAGRGGGDVHGLMADEAVRIGFDERFLARPMNVDLSGGERKRNETLQLGVLRPKIAILDEIDSGLDIDALRAVSRRVEAATDEIGLGVLAITHYRRLLTELRPDVVHVLSRGRIVAAGGPELADELERTGYAAYQSAPEGAPDPA
jgi:Fe-S cluster assembly ATP-binding protein